MDRRDSGPRRHLWAAVVASIAIAVFGAGHPDAHKPITSKYTFNDDVFPIVRDRCGQCHVAGGPAPMSLLEYQEAVPWAEAIREELVAERMPPWFVDPAGPAVRNAHTMSARDLDTIVTWAAGGTPEGDAAKRPAPAATYAQWTAGPPDLTIPMDAPHTLGPGVREETCTFTLATGLKNDRWVKAADLLPGTASMVREATIRLESGRVLAAWVPGHEVIATPSGSGFHLPAGAKLVLDVRYKKSWQDEQVAKSDRSAVGLYFTDATREVLTLSIDAASSPAPADGLARPTIEQKIASPITVLAVRPSLDRPYAAAAIDAVLPAGTRLPLLRLRSPRPDWRRRYWLMKPVDVPKGAKVEVALTPAPPDPDDPPAPVARYPLQIGVEFVAR